MMDKMAEDSISLPELWLPLDSVARRVMAEETPRDATEVGSYARSRSQENVAAALERDSA